MDCVVRCESDVTGVGVPACSASVVVAMALEGGHHRSMSEWGEEIPLRMRWESAWSSGPRPYECIPSGPARPVNAGFVEALAGQHLVLGTTSISLSAFLVV